MKKIFTLFLAIIITLSTQNVFSQSTSTTQQPGAAGVDDTKTVLKRLYYLGVIDRNTINNGVKNSGITPELSEWFNNNKIKKVIIDYNKQEIKDDDMSLMEKIGPRNYYKYLQETSLTPVTQSGPNPLGGVSIDEIKKEMIRILESIAQREEKVGSIIERWLITDQDTVKKILNALDISGQLKLDGSTKIQEYKNLIKSLNIVVVVSASKTYDNPSVNNIDSLSFYTVLDLSLPKEFRSSVFDMVEYKTFTKSMGEANLPTNYIEEKANWTASINKSYVYLSALKPEFLFYDSRRVNVELLDAYESEGFSYNGHQLSVFGQWGFDPIPLYGWYSDEITGGLKYSLTTTRNIYKPYLTVSLGVVNQFKRPFTRANSVGNMYNSGYAVFLRTETPLPFISDVWTPLSYFQVEFEGKFSFNELNKSRFDETTKFDFYTYRNYLNWELRLFLPELKNINLFPDINIGNLEFALGLTQVDLRHYTYDPFDLSTTEVTEKLPKKSTGFINSLDNGVIAKIALVKYHGYTTYKLEGFFMSNKWNSYFGGELEMLFNDFLGFTTKIAVNSKKLSEIQPWQKDLYIVFSPIIKFSF